MLDLDGGLSFGLMTQNNTSFGRNLHGPLIYLIIVWVSYKYIFITINIDQYVFFPIFRYLGLSVKGPGASFSNFSQFYKI